MADDRRGEAHGQRKCEDDDCPPPVPPRPSFTFAVSRQRGNSAAQQADVQTVMSRGNSAAQQADVQTVMCRAVKTVDETNSCKPPLPLPKSEKSTDESSVASAPVDVSRHKLLSSGAVNNEVFLAAQDTNTKTETETKVAAELLGVCPREEQFSLSSEAVFAKPHSMSEDEQLSTTAVNESSNNLSNGSLAAISCPNNVNASGDSASYERLTTDRATDDIGTTGSRAALQEIRDLTPSGDSAAELKDASVHLAGVTNIDESSQTQFQTSSVGTLSEFEDFGLDPDLFRPDSLELDVVSLEKTAKFTRLASPLYESVLDEDETDGMYSDDGLSSGGEFYDDNVEFRRPARDIVIKSVPIVPSQQNAVTERRGFLFKYTSEKSSISKLGSVWLKRFVTVDTNALKYFATNKSVVSKRVIPVCTMVNVEQDIKMSEVHPFRFRLVTVDRVYRFATDTSDDLAWWTSMLMRAILENKDQFQMCGEMNSPDLAAFVRLDGRRNKRYVVVKRGKLCLYNTVSDFRAFSPVHEVDLQLASVKEAGRFKLTLQLPQTAFTFVYDSQADMTSWKNVLQNGISYALGDDKILELVYANVSNRHCADCRAPGPEWAAINFGVTLCQQCAGVHRTSPMAKIRSLRMDCKVWRPSLIQLMKSVGNEKANRLLEAHTTDANKIDMHADVMKRTQFINSKYKHLKFFDWHRLRGNQPALNQALSESVQQSDVVETIQLVLSGADPIHTTGDGTCTPVQLSAAANQPLQTEFLLQNTSESRLSTSSLSLTKPTSWESSQHKRAVNHCGYLYVLNTTYRTGFPKRWFILQNGLFCCIDVEKSDESKIEVDQRDMISVASSTDERIANTFELWTTSSMLKTVLLAAESHEDRQTWLVKLARCMCPVSMTSAQQINVLTRAGLVDVLLADEQGWLKGWMQLCDKTLHVYTGESHHWDSVDVRKAASIKREFTEARCTVTQDTGPPVCIDVINTRKLYVHGNTANETESWFSCLHAAFSEIRNTLSCQPLTCDDVPVIIASCVNFICQHGLTAEGIYRRTGQNAVITQLLSLFNSGPRSVALSTDKFQIHEVSTVLKRFLRTLDDPLLTIALYEEWLGASRESDNEVKLSQFEALLSRLPHVNYCTLKCIITHLTEVADHESENLMGLTNLATIFAAVLVSSDAVAAVSSVSRANDEIAVVRYLLQHKTQLFDSQQLLTVSRRPSDVTDRNSVIDSSPLTQIRDDDHVLLKVYVESRNETSLDVRVSACMTASEVLLHIVQQEELGNTEDWALHEVICATELERPVHYSESVVDVMMRWARWPEEFRHGNYLTVKPAAVYSEVEQVFDPFAPLYSELKFASNKKTFKKYFFEFNHTMLSYRKESKLESKILAKWNVTQLVIYIGVQQQKNPTSRWALTFISDTEPPTSPYFGHSICFSAERDLYQWLAAMMLAQHPEGLGLPSKTRTSNKQLS